MEGSLLFSVIFTLSVLSVCTANQNAIRGTLRKMTVNMDSLREEVRNDLSTLATNLTVQMRFENAAQRSEIQQQVKESLEEFLEGDFLERLKTSIVSEMKDINQEEEEQTQKQLRTVMTALKKMESENGMCKDAQQRTARNMSELCSKCDVQTELMKQIVTQCNRSDGKDSGKNMDTTPATNLTTVQVSNSTTKVPPTTPVPAPVQHISEKKRLVIARWSERHFKQFNIHQKTLSQLPLPDLGKARSLCYVESTGRLLVGVFRPNKIMSTTLDGATAETLKEDVLTPGMAVDEGRGLIFISTWEPEMGISRMTLSGENYRRVRRLGSNIPRAIAVNSAQQELYVTTFRKVIRVPYSGDRVETLVTGHYILGAAFDSIENVLYYNDDKTLRRMTMTDEVSKEVVALDVITRTLPYYNNTLYYAGDNGTTSYVGTVQLRGQVTNNLLQIVSGGFLRSLLLCLVP